MNRNSILITVFLLLTPSLLFSKGVIDSVKTVTLNTPVSISYLGDYIFTKPGVKLSMENTIRQTILKKRSSKIVLNSIYYPINLSWYNHKGYNSALMLSSGIGYRSLHKKGLFFGSGLNLGIMRTFINGTTYTVDDSGEISTTTGGYFYGNINISLEAGYDFSKRSKSLPLSSFLKLNGLTQFPYNSGSVFHIMAEIGIRYALPLKDKAKQFYKTKTKKQ